MALEIGGGSELSWWDEEERKRRERLGIAGAPISPTKAKETVQSVWKGTPTRDDRGGVQVDRTSQEFVSAVAADADRRLNQDFVSAVDGQRMGPIEEWNKLERELGTEKLAGRMAAIKNILDSYMPNSYTDDMMWQLVKSPYDPGTITQMAVNGSLSDFVRTKDRTAAYEKLSMNWFGNDQMMAKHYVTYGDQTVSASSRLGAFASQNPVEALMLGATTLSPVLGGIPGILGKILGVGGAVGAFGTGMAQYGSATQGTRATIAQGNKPMFDTTETTPDYIGMLVIRPYLNDDDPLAKKFDELNKINSAVYGNKLDKNDLNTLVEWLKTDLTDPYTGQIILPAEDIEEFEEGLEQGTFSYKVANALLSRAAEVRNQEFDFKLELIERGYQSDPSADLSLPLASDVWKPALDSYNSSMLEQANAWERYPVEAAFRDARGFEWTDAGRAAAREALAMTGPLNMPFNAAFNVMSGMGGVQEALGARQEFVSRANLDPGYQKASAALNAYIVENYVGKGKKYSSYNTWEPSHVSQAVDYIRLDLMEKKGELENDEELIRLNAALVKEEMRLIAGDQGYFGKDYIASIGRALKLDTKGWEEIRRNNPQVVPLTNLFIDLGSAAASAPIWKAMKGGNLGLAKSDFALDGRVVSKLDSVIKHMDDGDLAAAARELGDTPAAQKLVIDVDRWAKSVDDVASYESFADEVYKLASKGDDKAVAKLFNGDAERASQVAAKMGEYVRTKGTSERSLAFFERQVKPGADAFGGTEKLTIKAQALLDSLDNGVEVKTGIGKLRTIARENGIKVAKGATAEQIITSIRQKSADINAQAANSLVPAHMQFQEAGGPTTGVGYPSAAGRKPLAEVSEAGQNWGPVPMPSGYSLQETAVKGQLSRWLLNEQMKHGTVFGIKPVRGALEVEAALAWANGANILPELRFSSLNGRNYPKIAIDSAIAKIKNKYLRRTLTEMTKWYHREPQNRVDLSGSDAVEIVHDWVLVATGDAKIARDMAAEAMRVKGPAAARAFEIKLQKVADEFLNRHMSRGTPYKAGGGAESMMGLKPKVGSEGKVLTYKTREGESAQVPTDTAMSKYTVNLGKDIMWAPYRLHDVDTSASLLVQGLQRTSRVVTQARNAWRKSVKVAYDVNSPLRNTAVGAGFIVLGTKHVVADTPRSWLAGVPVVNYRVVRKRFDNILTKMSPDAAEYVRYMRHRSEYTGQHYLTAVNSRWEETTLYGKSRNPLKEHLYGSDRAPQQLEAASDALRRMGQSKVFQAWAKDGPDAAKKWYLSTEGKKWMRDEGYYKAFRSSYTGPKLRGKALDDAVADWATSQYVVGYLEELRASAPHLLDGYADVPGLIKLAQTGQLDKAGLARIIREVGKREPSENLRLGVEREVGAGGNLVNRVTAPFIWGTKKAMIPDRFNRESVYNYTFNQLWTRFTKEGVDPDVAARTSAEIAYARSEQIHFDMSRAMEFETKYRGLAWFLADSRIYLQYWLKQMAERPTLAGAVTDFENWMEERNKDLSVPEWQKFNVHIGLGNGDFLTFDPRIYMWMTAYSAESLVGHGIERPAVAAANALFGTNIHPAPMDFGFNITRFDELGKAMFHVIDSPLGAKGFVPFANVADWNIPDAEWQEWLEKQSPAYREKVSRETHKRMALAELNGKPISWSEAMGATLASNLARQSYRYLRPSSTRIVTEAELEYNELMQRIDDAKDSNEVATIIEQNPSVTYMMGMGTDPWVKDELDDCRAQYFDAQDSLAAGLDRLYDEGLIMDKEAVEAEYKKFEMVKNNLLGSEVFSEWYNASRTGDLEKAIGYIMPGSDAEFMMMKYAPHSAQYKEDVKAITEANFKRALKEYNVMESEDDDPLYQMLKNFYITKPQQALKADSGDPITKREYSVARYLGRGGEAGAFRADRYLQMVKEQNKRDLVAKGISEGKAAKDTPFMAFMSLDDCESIGWNRGPEAEKGWWRWAVEYHKYKKYAAENIPSTGTTAEKNLWKQFDAWVEQQKQGNHEWAAEWDFSQKTLPDRLRTLGTGSGPDAESQGWAGFLDMADDYAASLKAIGVNAGTKKAIDVDQAYTKKLAKYAREHEEWWRSFLATGWAVSKFGWVVRIPGTAEDFLWDTNPVEEG